MNIGTFACTCLLIYFVNVNGMQSNEVNNRIPIDLLLSKREHIDTIFSREELQQIEQLRERYKGKITETNVDIILSACQEEMIPVLNKHKKSLKTISNQLFNECMVKHGSSVKKDEMKRLKFLTSPLPLILLVDHRFISLMQLDPSESASAETRNP